MVEKETQRGKYNGYSFEYWDSFVKENSNKLLLSMDEDTLRIQCICKNIYNVNKKSFKDLVKRYPDQKGCHACAGTERGENRRIKEEDIKRICEEKGIKFISLELNEDFKKSIVHFNCYTCGLPTSTNINKMRYRDKTNCNVCSKRITKNSLKMDFTIIENKMEEMDYILISKKDEYENSRTPIDYICKKHIDNGIQKTAWDSFKMNKGCYYCGIDKIIKNKTKTPEEFAISFNEIIGEELELLDTYINSETRLHAKHKACGNIIMFFPYILLNKSYFCPVCDSSKLETKTNLILKTLGFTFESQYSFSDCRNILPLPFDFVIFKNEVVQYAIEVQGPQHFEPVKFGGISIEKATENFELQIIKDKIKKDYCESNGIPIIILNYWEFNDFEQILKERLKND